MKLLVVSHSSATATNQRVYAELGRLTGWDITLVIPRNWKDEFGRELDEAPLPALQGKVRTLPVAGNGSIVFHFYRSGLRRILSAGAFDAIYVNHEPYALATVQTALVNLLTGKAAIGFYSCQNLQKAYPPPFSWLERFVYRRCGFALPITEEVAAVLRTKGFRGEITVCPLALDPELYHPRPQSEWPEPLRREGGVTLIGFAGRIIEAKGLRTLAAALGKIGDLRWSLAVIGAGEFEAQLKRLLEREGVWNRCVHIGFIAHEQTPRYLSALDLLVLPSETQPNWKEQFGRVIPEALASGVAVVGSDSGEIPNLIRASGGGRVFPERDSTALARELRELITNAPVRQAHAIAGREWVLNKLAVQPVAANMARAIEKAVNRRRG